MATELDRAQGRGVSSYFAIFLKIMLLKISGKVEVQCVMLGFSRKYTEMNERKQQ